MTDYADLIKTLLSLSGDTCVPDPCDVAMRRAADAIAALVKDWQERRIWCENAYQRGLRDGERIGLEKAAAECNRLGHASKYEKATQCYDDAADHIRAFITQEQRKSD